MKKILTLILLLCIVVGCGSNAGTSNDSTDSQNNSSNNSSSSSNTTNPDESDDKYAFLDNVIFYESITEENAISTILDIDLDEKSYKLNIEFNTFSDLFNLGQFIVQYNNGNHIASGYRQYLDNYEETDYFENGKYYYYDNNIESFIYETMDFDEYKELGDYSSIEYLYATFYGSVNGAIDEQLRNFNKEIKAGYYKDYLIIKFIYEYEVPEETNKVTITNSYVFDLDKNLLFFKYKAIQGDIIHGETIMETGTFDFEIPKSIDSIILTYYDLFDNAGIEVNEFKNYEVSEIDYPAISEAMIAKKENDIVGYAIIAKGYGFKNGEVTMMLGFDANANLVSLKALDVSSQNSGYGGRYLRNDHQEALLNFLKANPNATNLVKGNVDILAGATQTGNGLVMAYAEAYKLVKSIIS